MTGIQGLPSGAEQAASAAVDQLPEQQRAEFALGAIAALPSHVQKEVTTAAVATLTDEVQQEVCLEAVAALPDAVKREAAITAVSNLPQHLQKEAALDTVAALPAALQAQAATAAVDALPNNAKEKAVKDLQRANPDLFPDKDEYRTLIWMTLLIGLFALAIIAVGCSVLLTLEGDGADTTALIAIASAIVAGVIGLFANPPKA